LSSCNLPFIANNDDTSYDDNNDNKDSKDNKPTINDDRYVYNEQTHSINDPIFNEGIYLFISISNLYLIIYIISF
jgi:hypothetical protein